MSDLLRLFAVSCAAIAMSIGCSASPAPGHDGKEANEGDVTDKGDDSTGGSATEGDTTATAPGATTNAPAGLVVIDLQKAFFSIAKEENPLIDTAKIEANAERLLKAAGDSKRPVFVTYEATKSGDHAMPATLKSAEPAGTEELVKTTFGAMGLPAFKSAIEASGLKRFVIIGAETDVCVLQTSMGLRKAGFEVVAVSDALMTEEENTAPALRRYEQAGIAMVTTDQAIGVLNGDPTPAAAPDAQPKILSPLETGIVLNDVEGLAAADPNADAKKARLHELFLLTEWFKLPVMAADPTAATNALPSDLKSLLTKPILALANKPATVTNVAVAGGSKDLAQTAASLGPAVWIVSDAIMGVTNDSLEPLYRAGAVPSTYKSLYYELTVSVDDGGWPSQQWVQDGIAKYWDRTKAPEDLPPLTFGAPTP